MQLPSHAFDKSLLIVAHPDDEILWFSSIIDRFDEIVICYMDAGHSEELGAARRNSLRDHTLRDRITLLDLAQSKSHNMSQWPEPEETEYGLKLTKNANLDRLHIEQAQRLRDAVRPFVAAASNVFTHNPWGEYGHEDHVQVHRIVARLAGESAARLWFGNYVSNKSSRLMRRSLEGFPTSYYTMPVNREHARHVASAYVKNGAWTWIDDYQWPARECFVQDCNSHVQPRISAPFPVNYIRVPFDPLMANRPRPSRARRLWRDLRKRVSS
jgi:LmbE family N-acetylglucosaminyl deacetylase